MAARLLQRMIHVGCKQLRMDDDSRHDLQVLVTGKASMADMTEAEMQAVLEALKQRGFKPGFKGQGRGVVPRHPAPICGWCMCFGASSVPLAIWSARIAPG